MAAIPSGSTVSFQLVENFDTLPLEDATDVLYNQLIPVCEGKKVKLSSYGNHAGQGSLAAIEKYDREKAEHKLFNVERVQRAFSSLDAIFEARSTYCSGTSYGLKHTVEKRTDEYITNGDFIVAMLLKGYAARFGKRTESMKVNCEFKVKVLDE